MAAGKLEIKARIRSVESTKKITKAMQLVATSKLKKQKQYMEENREYAYYLKETVQEILSSIEHSRHPYLQKQEGKPYTIVFTSDMGLCGGYNANIFRMLQHEVGKEGDFVIIGARGANWIHNKDFHVVQSETDLEEDCYRRFIAAHFLFQGGHHRFLQLVHIPFSRAFYEYPFFHPHRIIKFLHQGIECGLLGPVIIMPDRNGNRVIRIQLPLLLRSAASEQHRPCGGRRAKQNQDTLLFS